jgi:hypothetical protein
MVVVTMVLTGTCSGQVRSYPQQTTTQPHHSPLTGEYHPEKRIHDAVMSSYIFRFDGVDGMGASEACCACGGGDMVPISATPAPTTTINTLGMKHPGKNGNSYCYDQTGDTGAPGAVDAVDWTNDYGQTCLDYELAEKCTIDGTFGAGWSFDYSFPELELVQSDGKSALEACCCCGGGSQVTYPPSPNPTHAPSMPPTPRPSMEPTKETLTVDDEVTYDTGLIRSYIDPLRDDDGNAGEILFNNAGKQDPDDQHLRDLDLWTLPDAQADVFVDAFAHLDKNENGYLTKVELAAPGSGLTESTIDQGLAATEDHQMDFAEFVAWRQEALQPTMLDPAVLPTPVTSYPTKKPTLKPTPVPTLATPAPTPAQESSYSSYGSSYGIDAESSAVLEAPAPAPGAVVTAAGIVVAAPAPSPLDSEVPTSAPTEADVYLIDPRYWPHDV